MARVRIGRGPICPATAAVLIGALAITARSLGQSDAAEITGTGGRKHYYVSPSGNDANPCTAAATCFTMQRVSELLAPGDTAHFASGTYLWGRQTLTVSGTATARVTFISDVRWGAKINGGCPVIRNEGDYVDFVNFVVTGSCATGIVVNGNYNGVVGNHVHDLPGNRGGWGGILVDCCKYTSRGTRVIGNVVHDIATALRQSNIVHGIYVADTYTVVQNNIVYRAAGWGIHLWHCVSHNVVSNNTVFENFNGGILLGGSDAECPFANTNTKPVVNNNIVYNNGTASRANGYGIRELARVAGGIVDAQYANNLVYGNKPANWGLNITGGQGTNTVTAAPLFVNYNPTGRGDYRQAAGSPAIDAGTSSGAPSTDFDGVPRPKGKAHDIGAYERDPSDAREHSRI